MKRTTKQHHVFKMPVTTFEFQYSHIPIYKENRNSVLKKLLVAQEAQKRMESDMSEDTVSVSVMGANFVNESFDYNTINKSTSIEKSMKSNLLKKSLGHKPVSITVGAKDLINNRKSDAGSVITI